MGSLSVQSRAVTSVGVLLAFLLGATALRAAIGGEGGAAAPRVQVSASGLMSLSNSNDGSAIFALANIAPGDSGQGEVTIGNDGSAPGTLALSSLELSDAPGRYGGALSGRLQLRIADVTGGGDITVYSGELASMPELQLGSLTAGESRTFRFVITMLEGGPPASPYVDDNLYQRGSVSIGYQWMLTEVEGGGEPGEPPQPPDAPVPAPAPTPEQPPDPAADPRPDTRMIGTNHRDSLVGTRRDDVIYGRRGSDRIVGLGGRDYIVGGSGADWLQGGLGVDRLRGGVGSDRIDGGVGPDVILAHDGEADFIDCEGGRDTAYVDERDRTRSCEGVYRAYGRLFPIEG